MIKIVIPNALMRAAADVIRQHPTEGVARRLSDTELKQLLRRIAACPEDGLSVLALSLAKREVYALCQYLPHNTYEVPLNKVTRVVSLRMNPEFYGDLFDGWQNFPGSREVLGLLSDHDTEKNHADRVKLPVGLFPQWKESDAMLGQINRYVCRDGKKDLFSRLFAQAGFRSQTPMEKACFAEYLRGCPMEGFVREGERAVLACFRGEPTAGAEQIFLNLLRAGAGDHKTLKEFPACFEVMAKMWGYPSQKRFPPGEPVAFKTYSWWFNYHEMSRVFFSRTHQRRKDFWEQYLDRCEVRYYPRHQMLAFEFEAYCAIEFEAEGRMYIYEKDRFRDYVLPNVINKSTSNLKHWLLHYSQPVYAKSHQGLWEPEVARELRKII